MDIATVIGLILGFGLILAAIAMGGSDILPFIDAPSMMIVFGGAFAALLINFPLGNVLGAFGVVMKCFLFKLPAPLPTIEQFKEFAAVAKRDGLLAMESKLEEVDDAFMRRGIESLIGGATPEQVRESMEIEVSYIEQRHSLGKRS